MPMVRRAATTNLGKFVATIESTHLKTGIMSMFDDLTQDDNFLSDDLLHTLAFLVKACIS